MNDKLSSTVGNRQCKKCGGIYDLEFFEVNHRRDNEGNILPSPRIRNNCRGGRQTDKDTKKARNRFTVKAMTAIRNHAKKYKVDIKTFKRLYGWDVNKLANLMKHAFESTCNECDKPFSEMDHGLGALTVDIIDPQQEPYFPINVRYICKTCNREKWKHGIEIWGIIQKNYRKWRLIRDKKPPTHYQVPLFS